MPLQPKYASISMTRLYPILLACYNPSPMIETTLKCTTNFILTTHAQCARFGGLQDMQELLPCLFKQKLCTLRHVTSNLKSSASSNCECIWSYPKDNSLGGFQWDTITNNICGSKEYLHKFENRTIFFSDNTNNIEYFLSKAEHDLFMVASFPSTGKTNISLS